MIVKSVCAIGMLMLCALSFGQSPYKTSAPEKQKVMEDLTYYYEVSSYTPAVQVDLTKPTDANTPEGAAMQILQAMHALDFDRWLKLWTPESQEVMKKQYKDRGINPDVFKNGWSKAFTGHTVALTKKIETGPYAIEVATFSSAGAPSGEPIEMEFVLKQVNGAWMATQEMMTDPVLLHWKTPDVVTKRIVRTK
jgi:hypothetical protein